MPKMDIEDLKTIASLARRLEKYGDHPAVIRFTPDSADTWSYRQLGQEARKVARGLRETGAEPGEKIAIMAGPSPEWFAVALGIVNAGGVLVPIDTQMADEDLERVFEDSGARRIFSTHRIAQRLREIREDREWEIFLLDETDEESDAASFKSWKSLCRDDEDGEESAGEQAVSGHGKNGEAEEETAILFYTSGTTGPPKGVPLTHRNILFQIQAIERTGLVREDDRLLLPLPLHHVYPLVIGVFVPLALGVAIVLPHALTGDAIVRALSEGKGTVILGVPRLYRALYEGIRAKVGGAGKLGTGLFAAAMALARVSRRVGLPAGRVLFRPVRNKMGSRVRMLASGGSPLDPELAENLEALGWPVAVGYGLTETSPLLTLKRPGEGSYASVGRPIEGIELKIDPSGLPEGEREAQEKGETRHERGEVLAKGPSVFGGYHNLPDKTEEALTDGWFRTGDLGYLDDNGFLCLGGRASSMIVLEGGENINPEDLENHYSQADEVAEIGILEDKGKLAALVLPDRAVLRERKEPRELRKTIEEALRRQTSGLPSYKRFSHVEITRQPLPTTRLGKIKRHVLDERYQAAKRGDEEEKRETGPVPIEKLSSEERTLLEDPRAKKLWDLLAKRYSDRRLTPQASLEFDLGIDSLEWVELSMSAQERAGVAITEELIEKAETIRDLLEAAAAGGGTEDLEGQRPIEEPEKVLSESEKKWATPRSAAALLVASVLYGLLWLAFRLRCPVEARGLEKLPRKGPVIFVPNHVSFLDGPALAIALGYKRARHVFFAGQGHILFRNFLRRGVSRLFQVFPIEPKRGPLSSLAVGALVVKRGHSLAWFPEGHVSKDGTLQDFRPGIGLIVDHYEPAIVPVHIEGSYEAMPLGRRFPRGRPIVVHFGEPLESRQLKEDAKRIQKGETHERLAKVLRESVKELGETVRKEGPDQPGRKAA